MSYEVEKFLPLQSIIRDVSLSCALSEPLDPLLLFLIFKNIEVDPPKYKAAVLRLRHPKLLARIFPSGKIVIQGVTNIEEAKRGLAKIVKKLRTSKAYPQVKLVKQMRVDNIMATISIEKSESGFIDLDSITRDPKVISHGDLEQFSGLLVEVPNSIILRRAHKVALLISPKGNILLNGCKSLIELELTKKYLSEMLLKHYVKYSL